MAMIAASGEWFDCLDVMSLQDDDWCSFIFLIRLIVDYVRLTRREKCPTVNPSWVFSKSSSKTTYWTNCVWESDNDDDYERWACRGSLAKLNQRRDCCSWEDSQKKIKQRERSSLVEIETCFIQSRRQWPSDEGACRYTRRYNRSMTTRLRWDSSLRERH